MLFGISGVGELRNTLRLHAAIELAMSASHHAQPLSVASMIFRAARDSTIRSWTSPRISTISSDPSR